MQHVGIQQNQRAEAKRQADLRKQILHHRILRSEAGTCEHLARFGGLPRAQQIEPRHGLAHNSDRRPTVRAAAVHGADWRSVSLRSTICSRRRSKALFGRNACHIAKNITKVASEASAMMASSSPIPAGSQSVM